MDQMKEHRNLLRKKCVGLRSQKCISLNITNGIKITCKIPLEYALPLYGFVMPVLVAITTITNTFIVIVLSQKHLRTPTNFVLLSMAIADLLTGLTSIPWFIYYYTLKGYEADERSGLNSFWCHVYPFLSYIIPTIWHTAGIWLTVFLAVQRYVYVCVPGFVHRLCTPKTTRIAVAMITGFSFLTATPDLFGKYMEQVDLDDRSMCVLRHSSWVLEILGVQLFYSFQYWFRVALVQLLPCILLIIFTYKLARTIKQTEIRKRSWVTDLPSNQQINTSPAYGGSINGEDTAPNGNTVLPNMEVNQNPRGSTASSRSQHRHSSQLTGVASMPLTCSGSDVDRKTSMLNSSGGSCSGSSGRSLYATNRMLSAICCVFLLLEVPAAFIFTLHFLIAARYVPATGAYRILNVALIIRNIFIVLSSPFNFFIYCSMSEQFRLTVRQLFSSRLLFVAQAQATFHGGKRYSLILVDVDFINQQQQRKKSSFVRRKNSSLSAIRYNSNPNRSRLSATQSIPETSAIERKESVLLEQEQEPQYPPLVVAKVTEEDNTSMRKMGRQVEFLTVGSTDQTNNNQS
ncbi:serpentine type 7TM GPCR chemoreceptor srw domain-containing protein [Ditylenchus destructor]|uniref:Serpentine type 7TM GPCR chemoreceptor srw domain-containing protein n=1 Tax=Ditylenchus destructor TaxID=166010 RepID=A0AAD4R020_9BILA|nr:serpentine type 7TM GPCR chemoreceptor srw domain-containing protein [Ditylenchus destructor]